MDTTIPKEPLKDFCLLELISHGTFGCCCKAAYNGRTFAIKFLEDIERYELIGFVREAAELRHENIVLLQGLVCEIGKVSFKLLGYRMEYFPLTSLDKYVDFASYRKRWEIDAVSAVCYLHTKNYVHRNICFAKFLVWDNFTRLKLSLSLPSVRTNLEDLNSQMFSRICCLAPECITENQYSKASDVFALVAFLIMLKTRDWEISKNTKYDGDFIHSLLLKSAKEIGTQRSTLLKNALHQDPRHRPCAFEIAGQLYNDIPDLSTEILKNIHIGMPVYCSTELDATALRAQNLTDVRICDTNGCDNIDYNGYAAVSTLTANCPLSNTRRTDLVLKKFQMDFLDFTKPHFIKYTAREVEINLRLRHDNIGFAEGIYVQQKNDAYLITGLVFEHHGTELCHYIREKREKSIINTSTIVEIATQIASALQFMHDQVPPVIHRDVNPNNILVSERNGHPHVKLIDYGHFRAEADLMTANLTDHNYIAPEIFATEREETNYTTAVDIYSFGMVMYFVTVGDDPFPEFLRRTKDFGTYINSPNEDGNFPRPEFHAAYEYPESLRNLIEDCWKHTPEERLKWDQINNILEKLAAMPE